MVDGQNFFDQPIKSNLRTHDNIPKIVTYQEGEIRNWYFLDYSCFKNYYKIITIDLSKQQKFGTDPKQYNELVLLEI